MEPSSDGHGSSDWVMAPRLVGHVDGSNSGCDFGRPGQIGGGFRPGRHGDHVAGAAEKPGLFEQRTLGPNVAPNDHDHDDHDHDDDAAKRPRHLQVERASANGKCHRFRRVVDESNGPGSVPSPVVPQARRHPGPR